MTIEEKAKAYDEAISIAKETYNAQPMYRNWLESMFPVLAKSGDEIRKEIISALKNANYKGVYDKHLAWLEKQEGQKPVWSEWDERNLEGIIDEMKANKNNAPDYDLATYDRFLSWLKSIKDRVQPQSQWKPSKEQLNNILDVLSFDNCTPKRRELLKSLYDDLNKL